MSSTYGLESKWEGALRELVAELERRASGRATLDDETKDYLAREFVKRLDVANNPDELLLRWQTNVYQYIACGLLGRRAHAGMTLERNLVRWAKSLGAI
jgi:hypothetical protein